MERNSRHLSTARLDRADAQILLASKCVAPSQLCTQMPGPPHSLHVLLSIFCSQMPVPPHAPPPYLLVLAGARPAALLALAPLPLALADAFAPAELAARSFVVVQAPRLTRLDRLGWGRSSHANFSRAWVKQRMVHLPLPAAHPWAAHVWCAPSQLTARADAVSLSASAGAFREPPAFFRVRGAWQGRRWRLRRLGR